MGEAAAVGTALLWTLSAVAWTSAGRYVGALSVSFLRLVITCVMLAVYGRLVRGLWLPSDADRGHLALLGLSGFFGFFLSDICLFKALLLIGPRVTLLIQALTPPLAAIMSWLCLDDRFPRRQWLAMLVTLAGVVWVVSEQPDDGSQSARLGHGRSGVVLALIGGGWGRGGPGALETRPRPLRRRSRHLHPRAGGDGRLLAAGDLGGPLADDAGRRAAHSGRC